jgi:NAD(P)-dependent dehydrogenase (short-subunit alcohol dehydrogenase family)
LLPKKRGTILFTGASASLRGRPSYGAFNSAKAGLRTLAQAMAKDYAEDAIHVGHVVVDGAIGGDKIFNRFPDAASREESMNPHRSNRERVRVPLWPARSGLVI